MAKKTTRVLISMPQQFLDMIDEMAEEESRSRSELIREALRLYIRGYDGQAQKQRDSSTAPGKKSVTGSSRLPGHPDTPRGSRESNNLSFPSWEDGKHDGYEAKD